MQKTANWADEAKSKIRVEENGMVRIVPKDLNNRDYRLLIEGGFDELGEVIAPLPIADFDPYLGFDLPAAKTYARQQIVAAALAFRKAVIGDADEIEVAGWSLKAATADRFAAGAASTQDIARATAEAAARGLGETADELMTVWAAKSQSFGLVEAALTGAKAAALRAVDAAIDIASAKAATTAFMVVLASLQVI